MLKLNDSSSSALEIHQFTDQIATMQLTLVTYTL